MFEGDRFWSWEVNFWEVPVLILVEVGEVHGEGGAEGCSGLGCAGFEAKGEGATVASDGDTAFGEKGFEEFAGARFELGGDEGLHAHIKD